MRVRIIFLGLVFYTSFFCSAVFAGSIDGTTSVQYTTTHQVFHNGEYATGYVKLNSGATILSDAAASFNVLSPLSGGLDLRRTGTLNLLGDLYLDTSCTLSGSGTLRGNGNIIFLNGDFTIPDNSVIHINSGTIIDGKGHNLIFGRRGRIFVDTNITLTLRNMRIVQQYNDFTDPCVRLAAFKSNLALEKVELALSQDFLFGQGQLFIHGDVAVTGTSAFIYRSTQHSFIDSNSEFYFDTGTTFSIDPATVTDCKFDQSPTYTSNSFILMEDKTSRLHFNEATLFTTPTGSRFAKGAVNFENQCLIKSNSAFDFAASEYLVDTFLSVTTENSPACVSYSPDGNYIAVVNEDSNTLQIFNSATLTQIGSDVTSGSAPVAVSWSNTSTQLVVVNSGDNSIKVYNFDGVSTPVVSVSKSVTASPICCAWSLYGKYIVVTNADDTAHLYKAFTLSELANISTDAGPASISWSPGGKIFAVANSNAFTIQIFSFDGVDTLTQVTKHTTEVTPVSVAWSQNGITLSVANKDSNSLQVFDFQNNALNLIEKITTGLNPVSNAWGPSGNYLGVVNSIDSMLHLSSFPALYTSNYKGFYSEGPGIVMTQWSPVESYFASINMFLNQLNVFSFSGSGNPSLVGSATTGNYPSSLSWSPEGNFVAVTSGADNTLQVFSFSGVGDPSFVGHAYTELGGDPSASGWSPDGNFIAVTNSSTKTLQVFSFSGVGDPTITGTASTGNNPSSLAWSPDGKRIAVTNSSSGTLQVFSFNGVGNPTSTGTAGTGSNSTYVAWSPDGKFVACIGGATFRVFSINDLGVPVQVGSPATINFSAQSLAWSSDGRFIIVVGSGIPGKLNIFTFNGHSTPMKVSGDDGTFVEDAAAVSLSSDGRFIVITCPVYHALEVLELGSSAFNEGLSSSIATNPKATGLSFSDDDSKIAVISQDPDLLQLFQINKLSPLEPFPSGTLTSSSPTNISWSPDGRFVAVGCEGSPNTLQVFSFDGVNVPVQVGSDISTGGDGYPVVSWSPDGHFVAVTNASSGTLQIFSFDGVGTPVAVSGSSGTGIEPSGIAWSPDGMFLAVGCVDKLQIFSFDKQNAPVLVAEQPASGGGTGRSAAWSTDGRYVAFVVTSGLSNVGVAKLYSFDGHNSLDFVCVGSSEDVLSTANSVAWSSDCRFMAVTYRVSNALQIFSFNGSALIPVGGYASTGSQPSEVAWSPNGKFLVVVNEGSDTLQVFSFDGVSAPSQVGDSINTDADPKSVKWSPDGNFVCVANYSSLTNPLRMYRVNYFPDRSVQAISNSLVFGDSAKGSDYDADVKVLAGSNVLVDGKVNYDCVN